MFSEHINIFRTLSIDICQLICHKKIWLVNFHDQNINNVVETISCFVYQLSKKYWYSLSEHKKYCSQINEYLHNKNVCLNMVLKYRTVTSEHFLLIFDNSNVHIINKNVILKQPAVKWIFKKQLNCVHYYVWTLKILCSINPMLIQ